MNILVANDDGINGEGLKQLVKELSKIANIYVVAPESQRSSTSHHVTIFDKIRYEKRKVAGAKKAFALWATPADCVRVALNILIDEKIDLVISGINQGRNTSTDIIYSGTIAAAREAFFFNIPAMAVSLDSYSDKDFSLAAEYAKKIALEYIKIKENKEFFINVNIPNVKKENIKGIMICDSNIDIDYNDEYSLKRIKDKDYVVITLNDEMIVNDDSKSLKADYNALKKGYVTISALHNEHISAKYSKVIKKHFKS